MSDGAKPTDETVLMAVLQNGDGCAMTQEKFYELVLDRLDNGERRFAEIEKQIAVIATELKPIVSGRSDWRMAGKMACLFVPLVVIGMPLAVWIVEKLGLAK